MQVDRVTLWSVAFGLAAWAVVLCMHVNPASDLARLRASAPTRTTVAGTIRSPATLYAMSCANCHQANGEGRFPVFPPLAGSPWVVGEKDRLIAVTLHGLDGPIEVNGVDYSGLMPGFAHLSDREIAALLTHVRSEWGNRAPPITEADVAAVRMRTSTRE